nr:MAG TPA: hypothetical protein [Caudoviricetes sp.]
MSPSDINPVDILNYFLRNYHIYLYFRKSKWENGFPGFCNILCFKVIKL